MTLTRIVLAVLALSLTTVVAAACTPAAPSTLAEDLVMKAYDVPAEHAAELQGIVSSLLWTAKDAPRKGAAALAPSGQLLVSAPAGFHPGIADVLARLKSGAVQAPPTVTLDYWVVVAAPAPTPAKGADVSPEIGDVVEALQQSQGPMRLSVLERLRAASQSGSEARIEGRAIFAEQTASLHGDKVVAKVRVRAQDEAGGLDARVEVPLGKTVVLGQAGTGPRSGERAGFGNDLRDGKAVTTFYVFRASVDGK
ncbi:MAG: hypothetical protein HYS27_10360 [Deltaproteobacteria bacterium]|nr:hypothetical protein [Deltaproteobacteria bacterium]